MAGLVTRQSWVVPGERMERLPVGVIVERQPVAHPWIDHRFLPVQVVPGLPEAAPWTELGRDGATISYLAGAAELALYVGETDNYKANLDQARPSVWVALRAGESPTGLVLLTATVDAGEAHALADVGDDLVEAVPMPAEIEAWMRDFVARHHEERPLYKRKRDRADPEALGTRGRVAGGRAGGRGGLGREGRAPGDEDAQGDSEGADSGGGDSGGGE